MSKTAKTIYEVAFEMDKAVHVAAMQFQRLQNAEKSECSQHKKDIVEFQQLLSSIQEKQKALIKHLLRSDQLKREIDQYICIEIAMGRKYIPSSLLSSIGRINADYSFEKPLVATINPATKSAVIED